MRIEAFIKVQTKFVAKRRRTEESGTLAVPVELDIPEIDAPIVLWACAPKNPDVRKAWRRDGDDYLVPLAGNAANPACRKDRKVVDTGEENEEIPSRAGCMGSEQARALFAENDHYGFQTYRKYLALADRKLSEIAGVPSHFVPVPDDARILPNQSAEAADLLRRHVEDRHVLVEGVLHQRRRFLPFIQMDNYISELIVEPLETGLPDRADLHKLIPLQDLAGHGSPDDELGYGYTILRKDLEAEIVRPDLLIGTGRRQLVELAAQTFVLNGLSSSSNSRLAHNAPQIAGTDRESLKAYVRLRDAFVDRVPHEDLETELTRFLGERFSGIAGTTFSVPGQALEERLRQPEAITEFRP